MTDLLVMRGAGFTYGGESLAISDASLTLGRKQVCGVLGPNGAGKSTLARLAAGVFVPKTGTVSAAGRELRTMAGPERARFVRVSFQTPEHELFRRTLGAELDWEASLLGVDRREMRERTADRLANCGATISLDAHPYDLDPWQRKLFACVSALAIPGRLVILDEPTLRLGQSVRTLLGHSLRGYANAGGGVMLVSHDHEFAAATCDRIVIVRAGKIDCSGPASSILRGAAASAATTIYTFPSFYLDRAVRRRSQLSGQSGTELRR